MVVSEKFLKHFVEFAKNSMGWCARESENEATKVNEIIVAIMNDVRRRNSLSEQTLNAIEAASREIDLVFKGSDFSIGKVVTVLKRLSNDQHEVHELMDPIVEALQFQDRLRQNLENLGKMLELWYKARNGNTDLVAFGKELLACTTSADERAVIRKYIPGLPDEEVTTDALFF